jgi:hypothetical protein
MPPDWMYVVLGGGTQRGKFAAQHYAAYFRKVKRDFEKASRTSDATYPEPVEPATCVGHTGSRYKILKDEQRRRLRGFVSMRRLFLLLPLLLAGCVTG